jgi:serine/threonine-protein kinase
VKQGSELDPFGWVGSLIDGKYRVDEVVGEGGFGVVYAGHHLGFDESIAIKCLKLDDAIPAIKRTLFLKGFIAEGRILYRLSKHSPHIVRAIDVGAATSPTGKWTPYLVLEWIRGRTLSDDLDARARAGLGGRSIGEAYELLGSVARALDTAHAEGVVHRDVKPANLLVAEADTGQTVKVLDFGVAKVMSQAGDVGGTTAPGTLVRAFSPAYASPEQFDSKFGSSGPWTDVFALALVFVEAVLGRRALEGDDVTQYYVKSTDPSIRPTLRTLGLDTSDTIERVLQRALAVDPRNRFQRAGEFWQALGVAVENAPAPRGLTQVARTVDATTPARTEIPEHPITIPGVPPPTMTHVPAIPLDNAGVSATRDRRRGRRLVLWLAVAVIVFGVIPVIWIAGANLSALSPAVPSTPVPQAPTATAANDGTDANRPLLPNTDMTFVDARGWGWGDRCWNNIKAGRWGWAKAECDKGMATNPTSPQPRASLLYNEGLIAKAAGHVEEARLNFTGSLSLRENAEVRAALDALGGGGSGAH